MQLDVAPSEGRVEQKTREEKLTQIHWLYPSWRNSPTEISELPRIHLPMFLALSTLKNVASSLRLMLVYCKFYSIIYLSLCKGRVSWRK